MTAARHRLVAIAALAAVAISLAIAIPAIGANHTNTPDANDTEGTLDLRVVSLDHYPGPLRWSFRTFARWAVSEMWDRGYLVIELDTSGDKSIDERIVVRSDGRTLDATLYEVRGDGSEVVVANLRATKDGGHSASVEISFRRLDIGRAREEIRWYALSLFTGASCKRVCIDRVPDEGRLEQLLPGVSPTPTPTPTPSPTPSPTGPTGATATSQATGGTGPS